ncbi:MAG: DUF3180 domain-containing protein [Candidatus Nanopelagicales bacterium]
MIRLVGVAAVAAAIGWMVTDWVDSRGRLVAVAWSAVVVIWVVAGFVGAWTLAARRRLQPSPDPRRRPAPMNSVVAARTTALAFAGSRTGAIVFGLYGGVALRLLPETGVAVGRERLLAAALAAFGGLVLTVLSLWLERICRLPEDTDDPEGAQPGRDAGPAGAAT